jgi:tetratricopeptide (TPR) repeat protein
LLSACRTDQQAAVQGRLARALVEQQAAPAAIGMQGPFPDDLSDDLAAALYAGLLGGQPLGRALLSARLALRRDETAVPLPVAYVARGGDAPLPLQAGRPARRRLDLSAHCHLPPAVQAPDPFLGRNADLHQLARLAAAQPVITIIGAGGMGKTALAAAYARRFALRYLDGVLGYSFAAGEVDDGAFRRELLARLLGDGPAAGMADQPAGAAGGGDSRRLRERELLLLVDNYESVQEARDNPAHAQHAPARAVHALLAKIANNGGRLLLTSRRQPAGLKHERVFPGRDHLLQGVDERAGAALFFTHSPRANERRGEAQVQKLARAVARETAGHPLAIALLGAEYDLGHTPPQRFLAGWPAQLRAARSHALDDHHATFTAAFGRSYDALSPEAQARLRALSVLPFPFFDVGAALLWGLDERDDAERSQTRRHLRELSDRSLIEIDLTYSGGDRPATWRFQPALRQAAADRLTQEEAAALQTPFARYAAWLSSRAYGDIHKEGNAALVRLVRPALDSLAAAADHLAGTERLWHLRRVGWLLNAFGRTRDAYDLLTAVCAEKNFAAATAADPEGAKVRSSLLYEIARLEVTRGDLDRALALYQESLAALEQIGDIKGKAASLHQMAQVYLTRGDLDRALALYQESLAAKGANRRHQGQGRLPPSDGPGLSRISPARAAVYDLDRALALYQESLALKEQIGDIPRPPPSNQMAQVYLTRGDLDRALALYQESLALWSKSATSRARPPPSQNWGLDIYMRPE